MSLYRCEEINMTRQPQEGDTVNIYEQDFKAVRAYATTSAGQVFFGNIEGGAILQASGVYSESDPTVYVGKFQSERDGTIDLADALVISPVQLKNAQRATNYSALDVLRALYHEVRTMAPAHLSQQKLRKEDVIQELNLENIVD
jgi:hypothetical protein